MSFLTRLTEPRPILLDGATGSELTRRAVDTGLPLWSARALVSAPEVLRQIHSDYLRAGAEIITANTFRTHRRSLAHGGLGHRALELTSEAVSIARDAVREHTTRDPDSRIHYVAGPIAPLEDCYSPQLVPSQAECEREHAEIAQHLADAGVDLILIETMNTIREALAALKAARSTGLPVLASFVCGSDGKLLSGETVRAAFDAATPLGVVGVLINCTPSATIHEPLGELAALAVPGRTLPIIGVYANIGHTDAIQGWTTTADVSPIEYAQLAAAWLRQGARLVGGCCGTTPAHIAALHATLG